MSASTIGFEILFILILLAGIFLFRDPRRSRLGTILCAIGLFGVVAATLGRHAPHSPEVVAAVLCASAIGAWLLSARADSLKAPVLVALQNGAGGMASLLVSYAELGRNSVHAPMFKSFGLLGVIVGAVTFSGSMVAGGKLSGMLASTPVRLPYRRVTVVGVCMAVAALYLGAFRSSAHSTFHFPTALAVASLFLGLVLSIPVGGADMPVMISLLNSFSGLAAAFCGILTQSRPLIVCGSLVGASGLVLTHAMCRAMNRKLFNVLAGSPAAPSAEVTTEDETVHSLTTGYNPTEGKHEEPGGDPVRLAVDVLQAAQKVMIIPGYGMALAQAQFETVSLANRLQAAGKDVGFAIHPVAGRMPGHMNVVLAEAGVDYERLLDLEPANQLLAATDVALVVGACDVVNPAAITKEGTPISGMPVLLAHKAARVIVCNLDEKPGYSGVDNPLYADARTILLLGDAKESIRRLLESFD